MSLQCSTFCICDSPGNQWKQSTTQRQSWRMRPASDSPCVQIKYWQNQDLLLCESTPVWNAAQTGNFSLYLRSSLKGNILQNPDVFKWQQGLQGHYVFLILLPLLSKLAYRATTLWMLPQWWRPKEGKAIRTSFLNDGRQINLWQLHSMSIPSTDHIII